MAIIFPAAVRISGQASAIAAATEIPLSISGGMKKVTISRIKVKRVSGTAATFQPLLVSATGAVAGSINQEFRAAAATAVADLFDSVPSAPLLAQTDASGKLYLVLAPNAGSDNVFDYVVWVMPLAGGS